MSDSVVLYQDDKGRFFTVPYKAAVGRLRGEKVDPASAALLAFKGSGDGSGRFLAVVESVMLHLKCDAVAAVCGSGTEPTSCQRIVASAAALEFKPDFARANRHNFRGADWDAERERERVALTWNGPKRKAKRLLLIDDICTTGWTLDAFAERLVSEGAAREVIRFSFARSQCRFKRVATLAVESLPDVIATGAAPSDPSDPLRRLRLANAKLAELELSIREGETLETAAVQVAYAEVVGIVRSGLRALPRRIASELENQPAAVIEKAVDRMVRELADGFEKRCGEVGLVAKPKKERKGKKS